MSKDQMSVEELVAIPVVELESKRFGDLDAARDYVSGFSIADTVQSCGKLEFKDGVLKIPGQDEVMFTRSSWGQFVSEVAPGASRFLNYGCPEDLRNDIVNRMLQFNCEKRRMIRIERQGNGQPYVKAYLSEGYKPYNNKEFIDYVQKNASGDVIRPSVDGGKFSVNFLNKNAQIEMKDGENNRLINLGVTYRNSEDGSYSISANPFTFDSFCTNGTIFGKKFLDAMSKRVVHRGAGMLDRVQDLMITAGEKEVNTLKLAFINMQNAMMTALYFKRIAQLCIYPMKIMPQKSFEEAVPFVESESRFGFYNRINEFAHKGGLGEGKRLEFERLAGVVVEENMLF